MRRTMLSVPALIVLCMPRVSLAQTTPVSPPSARFDATAVRYEVPASNTSGGFLAAAMGTTNKHWLLYDMNADGKPDLVQTRDPGNPDAVFGVNVKNEHWRVWSGTPTGSNPKLSPNWGLPSSGTAGGFRGFGAAQTIRQWIVVNFDERKRPSLLQTQDPTTSKVWMTADGHPYWKMFHTDSNARFGTYEIHVIVGNAGKEKGFYTAFSGSGTDQWTLMDMNKDGRLDLVQTTNPETGKVWSEGTKRYWRVYYNNTGFGTNEIRMDIPTQWTVPEVGAPYTSGFNVAAVNDGNKQWVTFDIDGDGIPELVHTADPATGKVWGSGTATPYWKVYKKDGWGFSKTPISWWVPESGSADGFDAATSAALGRNWVTIDLDGDGRPDLVQTSALDGNKVWGAGTPGTYWKLYKNSGSGFVKTPVSYPVPASGTADGFATITAADGNKQWTLVDIDGDARLDLVQTADPATGDVWGLAPARRGAKDEAKPYWKVYRGQP